MAFLPETAEVQERIEKQVLTKRYVGYDKDKIIRMLLVHDFSETALGDVPSFKKPADAADNEIDFIQKIGTCGLMSSRGVGIGNLYTHFEEPLTQFERDLANINTVIAKEIDAIECFGQLVRYLKVESTSIPDQERFKSDLRKRVTTEIGKEILAIVE